MNIFSNIDCNVEVINASESVAHVSEHTICLNIMCLISSSEVVRRGKMVTYVAAMYIIYSFLKLYPRHRTIVCPNKTIVCNLRNICYIFLDVSDGQISATIKHLLIG